MSFYLYGILPVPGPTDLDLVGLDDQPVLVQLLGEFSFLYSPAVRTKYRASRQNLLTHEKVLEEVMRQGFTGLLPLQFGLVAPDWPQVEQDLLHEHQPHLHLLLAQLAGMREVSIKIYWDPDLELQHLACHHPQIQAQRAVLGGRVLTMDETIAVGRMVESALLQEQTQICRHFDQLLTPLAREIKINDTLSQAMMYNRAFLIPWEDEPHFDQAVASLGEQYGDRLRIRYNNFTAPYNFAMLGG